MIYHVVSLGSIRATSGLPRIYHNAHLHMGLGTLLSHTRGVKSGRFTLLTECVGQSGPVLSLKHMCIANSMGVCHSLADSLPNLSWFCNTICSI